MYHPALASRRRRLWPIFLPFLLVVLAAAGWSAAWYYAANRAEATIGGWREREAGAGRVYSCGSESIGGFPFRIEVRCHDPGVELRNAQPPLVLKAEDLLVAAQIYQPTLLIGEFEGPLSFGELGRQPSVIASWRLAQASVRGQPSSPERVSVVLDDVRFDRVGATQEPVALARRLELHGRMASGSARSNPVIDLLLRLGGASAPTLHPAAAQPVDGEVAGVLRGLKDFSPKGWAERFRELHVAGGRIEITKARLQQGETIAVGSGTLGLTATGGLDGQLQVTVAGLESLLQNLGIENQPSQGQAQAGLNQIAPMLGALDRVVPGLGNFARQQAVAGIAVGLGGQRTELEGRPAVTLPLRFEDGAVFLGRLQIGRAPALF